VAALVKGFRDFDPQTRMAGVLCNRVAGPRHYEYLEAAIRRYTDVEPLGWLPARAEWTIPERHLGLTTAEDLAADTSRWERLVESLIETVDVDRLLRLAAVGEPVSAMQQNWESAPVKARVRRRVAVARDVAFCFYYPENLELLESAGAELVPFSPLADACLPNGIDLLYLGGGYPELHAQRLAENTTMRSSIRHFHRQGGKIYAECGGMMYVGHELVDADEIVYPMLDLLPVRTVMQQRRAALGYVTWRAVRDTMFGPVGTELRGHEFHYSRLELLGPLAAAGMLQRDGQPSKPDGFVQDGLLAGYAHLHFGSNPAVAEALLSY
jgi:cobyrinic acid a,c-diamide synthase